MALLLLIVVDCCWLLPIGCVILWDHSEHKSSQSDLAKKQVWSWREHPWHTRISTEGIHTSEYHTVTVSNSGFPKNAAKIQTQTQNKKTVNSHAIWICIGIALGNGLDSHGGESSDGEDCDEVWPSLVLRGPLSVLWTHNMFLCSD